MHLVRAQPRLKSRRGVAEIVGVLLMVIVVVSAALLVAVVVNGLFQNLTKGGPSTFLTTTSVMIVPGTYDGNATLSITLTDRASQDISSVSFSCPVSTFATSDCRSPPSPSFPLGTPLTTMYDGIPVGVGNVIPVGQTGSANGFVQAAAGTKFTGGTSYVILIEITFLGGSGQIIAVNIPTTS